MKILYVVPGAMKKNMGEKELERRVGILRSWAFPGTQVDIMDYDDGPSSIESSYEEYQAVPGVLKMVMDAEKNGYDGAIIGCFDDPGIDAAKEAVSIPVVGPGECALTTACVLGTSYSILSVLSNTIPSLKKRAKVVGVYEKLASVRAADVPVLELPKNPSLSEAKIKEAALKAVNEDGADVIVLGCMSMAFLGVSDRLQQELGIPVVNPARISLKMLEGIISAGLSQSKKGYPYPAKWGKK